MVLLMANPVIALRKRFDGVDQRRTGLADNGFMADRRFSRSRGQTFLCQRLTAGLLLAAVAISACAAVNGGGNEMSIAVSYEDIAPAGYIDQTATLSYSGQGVVVPTIRYTPVDAAGSPIEGVEVQTAFGSDRGLLALAAPGGFDILSFHGARAPEVVAVESAIVDTHQLSEATASPLGEPTPFRENEIVTKFDVFDSVEVENLGAGSAFVRVVCLVYNSPAVGEAQQADEVAQVVARFEVSGSSRATAAVDESFVADLADRGYGCDSLKAHLTP